MLPFGQLVMSHLAEHTYEAIRCHSLQAGISQLSLQSTSVLLSFVLQGSLCGQSRCILSSPQCSKHAVCKHSSMLSEYNPFSGNGISPKIPRTTDSRWIVGVNQCSRSVCLILCEISYL